jgi:hypothetical protein
LFGGFGCSRDLKIIDEVGGYEHEIVTPHPAWFYAVARNQILRGSQYLSPGVDVESVLEVINRYGIVRRGRRTWGIS